MISEFQLTNSRVQYNLYLDLRHQGFGASCDVSSMLPVLTVEHPRGTADRVESAVLSVDPEARLLDQPRRRSPTVPFIGASWLEGSDFVMSNRWVQYRARSELRGFGYPAECVDDPAGPLLRVTYAAGELAGILNTLDRIDPDGEHLLWSA